MEIQAKQEVDALHRDLAGDGDDDIKGGEEVDDICNTLAIMSRSMSSTVRVKSCGVQLDTLI